MLMVVGVIITSPAKITISAKPVSGLVAEQD
jgi:hypothetical protein